MVGIVDEIMFNVAVRVRISSRVNKYTVVDREPRVRREVRDEKIAARENCIEPFVGLLLIRRAALEKHAGVAESDICGPAQSDTLLHHCLARLAHRAQARITREN